MQPATSADDTLLMDYLNIERVPHDDPRRGPYWNLFEIWYQRHHGLATPYLYSENGKIFWHVTPESARMAGLTLVQLGVFNARQLLDYKRELQSLCLDKVLGDDLFIKELDKLNQRFLPLLELNEVQHGLLQGQHHATRHNGGVYCPSCDALGASLHKAENAPEIAAALAEMSPEERTRAQFRMGLREHIKSFRASSAHWLVPGENPGSVRIDLAALVRR